MKKSKRELKKSERIVIGVYLVLEEATLATIDKLRRKASMDRGQFVETCILKQLEKKKLS
jgi:hypothetical protein